MQTGRNGRLPTEAACMRFERDEKICLDARLHGVVLARPLARSLLLVALGMFALLIPSAAAAVLGAILIAAGAAFTLRAVWQWERTRVVVTTQKVYFIRGTLHRRAKAVRLQAVDAVEIDQSLLGQLFGYGTVVVGPLSIGHIAAPSQVCRLVERLAS
jgi:uncharacterized membrane protein YdbT with pleckstrin-like domain